MVKFALHSYFTLSSSGFDYFYFFIIIRFNLRPTFRMPRNWTVYYAEYSNFWVQPLVINEQSSISQSQCLVHSITLLIFSYSFYFLNQGTIVRSINGIMLLFFYPKASLVNHRFESTTRWYMPMILNNIRTTIPSIQLLSGFFYPATLVMLP